MASPVETIVESGGEGAGIAAPRPSRAFGNKSPCTCARAHRSVGYARPVAHWCSRPHEAEVREWGCLAHIVSWEIAADIFQQAARGKTVADLPCGVPAEGPVGQTRYRPDRRRRSDGTTWTSRGSRRVGPGGMHTPLRGRLIIAARLRSLRTSRARRLSEKSAAEGLRFLVHLMRGPAPAAPMRGRTMIAVARDRREFSASTRTCTAVWDTGLVNELVRSDL